MGRRLIKKEEVDRWVEMYNSGLSIFDISNITGATRNTIRKFAKGLIAVRPVIQNDHSAFLKNTLRTEYGCIIWTGGLNNKGYGSINISGELWLAHRYAYHIYRGNCKGLHVCHTCDNPKCVNPDHLFLGTSKDNMVDMAKKLRSPSLKLTPAKVKEIRIRLHSGERQSAIAKEFNISKSAISDILTRKTWSWL